MGRRPTLTECSWRKAQGLKAELASGGAEATQDPPPPRPEASWAEGSRVARSPGCAHRVGRKQSSGAHEVLVVQQGRHPLGQVGGCFAWRGKNQMEPRGPHTSTIPQLWGLSRMQQTGQPQDTERLDRSG